MRVAIGLGERNPKELTKRLFDIKPASDDAAAREAQTALLRANPHLDFKRGVPKGAIIIVPEIAGIRPTEEAKPVGSEAGEMINEARRGLVALRAKLNASADRHTKEANETLRLLKSPQVKEAIKSVSEAKDRASEIGSHARARLEEAKNLKAFAEQVLPQLDKDIEGLVKRFSQADTGSSGPSKGGRRNFSSGMSNNSDM
jgi:hypothetical protein